jgi:hypothetical protein
MWQTAGTMRPSWRLENAPCRSRCLRRDVALSLTLAAADGTALVVITLHAPIFATYGGRRVFSVAAGMVTAAGTITLAHVRSCSMHLMPPCNGGLPLPFVSR